MGGGGDSSQEKTEEPTPKRLRDARKKGQVFQSKDLEAVMVFISIFAAVSFSIDFMTHELENLMREAFSLATRKELRLDEIYQVGKLALMTAAKTLAPILGTGFLVAGLVGFLQVGPLFSMETLTPTLNKLNAIENLKNMFKTKTFFELFKNIVKMTTVFLIGYSVLKGMLEPFLLTVTIPIEGASKLGGMVLTKFIIRFLIVFLILAIVDFFMQKREYMKNLKMSKEEIKREYKEEEGDPHIKGHRRQLHQEMAMGDTRQRVQNADAVVTNPTHLAVAIKYDKAEMSSPQVVAKGQRLYAEFIKDLAKEYEIPIIRNIPLAWALIELEQDDEIPEKLYTAVAEILTFVYRLKEEKKAKVSAPAKKAISRS